MFNSRIAGTDFFANVEKLDKSNRVDISLAIIHYFFINLGFSGKFNPETDFNKIEKYKLDLFRTGFGVEFSNRTNQSYIASNYKATVEPIERSYLPTSRKFNTLSILSVVLLAIGTHGLWLYFAKEIEDISKAIILTRFQ